MAWIYSGVFRTSHANESRAFFPLEFWHLMNCSVYMFNIIPPLSFAVFPLSVLGRLEGGDGPGSFPWLALGGAGLAASCARQCTENLMWSAQGSAGRGPVAEPSVS